MFKFSNSELRYSNPNFFKDVLLFSFSQTELSYKVRLGLGFFGVILRLTEENYCMN